jgi:hypothetical protein
VVGDLEDLVPVGQPDDERPFDQVDRAELVEAAEAALAALAVGHARLFRRYRQAFVAREGRPASAQEVVGSTARVVGFGVQRFALRRTAESRLFARAARAYVARTSGRR